MNARTYTNAQMQPKYENKLCLNLNNASRVKDTTLNNINIKAQ